MSRKLIDLTGMTFGRLTVIERAPNIGVRVAWRCSCSCGNLCVVEGSNLKNGHTQSCGCLQSEKNVARSTKHSMSGNSIYSTWQHMLQRCENPNNKDFDNYGGRGIRVCDRWHVFENFYADVSLLPHFGEKGYTLDRINNDGDYCPSNVRWANQKQQARNRRTNVKVNYNGVEMCLMDAAEKSGIKYDTLKDRYYRGLRGDDLFSSPKFCAPAHS